MRSLSAPFRQTSPLRSVAWWVLCGLALTSQACAGCDDGQGNAQLVDNNAPSPSPDMDQSTPPTGATTPAPVWPAYVIVEVEPARASYRLTQTLVPSATVVGTDGEVMSDVEIVWEVTPESVLAPADEANAWVVAGEGRAQIEGCTVALGFDGQPVCASLPVIVNDAAPTLMITSPMPGDEIVDDGTGQIQVTGQVVDTFGESSVFVNGASVPVGTNGAFSLAVDARFGINHIDVQATDGLGGAPATAEFDVLWAAGFDPGLGDPPEAMQAGTRFDDGLLLRLGQRFFDDHNAPAITPEGAAFTDDFADVLVLLLRYIDASALITNPVVDNSETTINVEGISLGPAPDVQITITEDGLELFMQAPMVAIQTSGQLSLAQEILDLDGTIEAGVSITGLITIDKPQADQPFDVAITDLRVGIERATSSFFDARTNAIFELAQSALRTQIEQILVDALRGSFIDTLPTLLAEALGSLESALSYNTFELDAKLGNPPSPIVFEGLVPTIERAPRSHMTLPIATTLAVDQAPTLASRGVALMTPFVPQSAPLYRMSRAQIALRLAAINGLLQGLWRTGFFEIDATSLLPEEVSGLVRSATISAKLPPVVAPPLRGEPFDLMLHVGQLELTLDVVLGNQTVTYGVSMSAGVMAGLSMNSLSFAISDAPTLDIWVISVEGDSRRLTLEPETLESILLTQLWPQLTASLSQGLGLPLPVLDIPALGQYAPELATFSLAFDQVRPLIVDQGYLLVDARLRGTLPAPQ